jgi:hypothetical protein
MYPALVHLELHVWLGLWLSVHNKHQIVTIICDAILIYKIAKCNDVCDGSGAEPYSFVVAFHRFLSSNYHGATIALELHAGPWLANLAYQGCVTEEIHGGLTVEKDNLLEIKFDRGSCLFE